MSSPQAAGTCRQIVYGPFLNTFSYDHLLAKYRPPTSESSSPHLRATGVQIAVDKITYALAAHQRNSIKTLLKEKRSYGLWSPSMCNSCWMLQGSYAAIRTLRCLYYVSLSRESR